jgi:tRNA threonylcarbamoyl adenosine modification protein YeaZ
VELAIDTSTDLASIALSSQGEVIEELTWHAGRNHTIELMPNVVGLLERASASRTDISGIVVATGPGSFNGLRVGMSAARGLAFALRVPIVGISTLEVEAFPYADTGLPVCPILDVGRGEIAAALFQLGEGRWSRLVEESIVAVDDLLPEIGGRTVFCGSIPPDVVSRLREGLGGNAMIMSDGSGVRRASCLAELGWGRLKEGDPDHSPTLQPLYLRRPSITVSNRRPLAPRP